MAEDLRKSARRRFADRISATRQKTQSRSPASMPASTRRPTSPPVKRSIAAWAAVPWIWVGVLTLTAAFQWLRGAPADGIAFAAMALLLAADALGLLAWMSFRAPAVPRIIVIALAVVLGLIVVIAPMESTLDRVTLILIGVGLFVLVWPDSRNGPARGDRSTRGQDSRDRAPAPLAPAALARTGIVWGGIAVIVCVLELTNYFLALPSAQAIEAHPTISSLVEPFVDWPIGRIIFVIVWLLAGLALLRKGPEKR